MPLNLFEQRHKMVIQIKNINENKVFELMIDSDILINNLHKVIRRHFAFSSGTDGVDVIRINDSLHILLYFESLDKYVVMNHENKSLRSIIEEYNCNQYRKERFCFLSFEHFESTDDFAEQLYFGYDCSFVEMGKDGWYEIYKLCNVPVEKEKEWKIEYFRTKVDNKQQTD